MSLLGLPFSKGVLVGGAVLVLALAAVSGLALGQAKTIGKLQAQNKVLEQAARQEQVNFEACQATKIAQAKSLAACISEVRVAKDENDLARQSIDQLAVHIRETSESLNRERAALYRATPSCANLAQLDIAGACPGVARSLRERSRSMSTAREGTNANPGAP